MRIGEDRKPGRAGLGGRRRRTAIAVDDGIEPVPGCGARRPGVPTGTARRGWPIPDAEDARRRKKPALGWNDMPVPGAEGAGPAAVSRLPATPRSIGASGGFRIVRRQ